MIYDIERKRVVGAAEAHVDDINSVAYADSAHQPHIIVSASDDTFVKVWSIVVTLASVTQGSDGVVPSRYPGVGP